MRKFSLVLMVVLFIGIRVLPVYAQSSTVPPKPSRYDIKQDGWINKNIDRINVHKDKIKDNHNAIGNNADDITDNKTLLNEHKDKIKDNSILLDEQGELINDNTVYNDKQDHTLDKHDDRINTNADGVSHNGMRLDANKNNILINRGNIGVNAGNISVNSTRITDVNTKHTTWNQTQDNTLTDHNNRINNNVNRLNDHENRLDTLEETQVNFVGEVNLIQGRKYKVSAYGKYNTNRNTCSEVGVKFTYSIGDSWETRQILKNEERLKNLEEKLNITPPINRTIVKDTKGNIIKEYLSISTKGWSVNTKF